MWRVLEPRTPESSLTVHFFTHYCHPAGTYFRFHNLARALCNLGHNVTVFAGDADTSASKRDEVREGVLYHIHPDWRGARVFGAACHPGTAWTRARRVYPRADVIHLFQPFPSGTAAWHSASRSARVRCFDWDDLWIGGLVKTSPFGISSSWMERSVNALERQLPRRADHTTTCSGWLSHLAQTRGAAGTTVVPNGFWPAAPIDRAEARRRFGLADTAIVAGYMGHTVGELSWCFDALARIAEQHPSLVLAVCGPSARALESIDARMRSRIRYLGVLPPTDIPHFVAALDLGLLPLADSPFNRSRFPIKFAEYLGGGCSVLLSDVGECAVRAHDWPGVITAGTTSDAWCAAFASAIDRIASGVELKVDMGVIERQLSWHVIGRDLDATYRRLLDAT